MKLAVMQPYFFPYIGYFQLIQAVDCFVLLDDVNYIKQGWINRNRILLHSREHFITVPLQHASQNRRICDIAVLSSPKWRWSMLRTLQNSYGKAPQFDNVFPLVESVLLQEDNRFIHELAEHSILSVCGYLGISAEFRSAAQVYADSALKGAARILSICEQERASEYFNLSGGSHLYRGEQFAGKNIALKFIRLRPVQYPQRRHQQQFVPCLSILDAMMFNEKDVLIDLLSDFDVEHCSEKS